MPAMKRPLLPVLWIAVLLAASTHWAAAETVQGRCVASRTVQACRAELEKIRLRLYARDADDREDALEEIIDSLDEAKTVDDAEAPLRLLGDLVIGAGRPGDGALDNELREEAAERLAEEALDDDLPLSRRETALAQLGRAATAQALSSGALRALVVDTLTDLAGEDRLPLAHGALAMLGRIATHPNGQWRAQREGAAEVLIDHLDHDLRELRRIAMLEAAAALLGAKKPDEAAEDLWEALTDAVEDIDSPVLFADVAPVLRSLVKAHAASAFEEAAEDLGDALKDVDAANRPAEAEFADALQRLAAGVEGAEAEALLARLTVDSRSDAALRNEGVAAMTALAAKGETDPDGLRLLVAAMSRQARDAGTPLAFYRTASSLLELSLLHGRSGYAQIPASELARLLASTEHEALLIPVLGEVGAAARSKAAPAWVARRLVGLLFLQAGDSPSEAVRSAAMDELERVAKAAPQWAVRLSVGERMAQLAEFARETDVKTRAAAWLKG